MFDFLTDKLQDTVQALRREDKITEENIEFAITKVRRALLESDVSLKAVKLFTTRVTERALGEEVLRGVKPGEQFVKIIHDALVEILSPETDKHTASISTSDSAQAEGLGGESAQRLNLGPILLLGLQGAGKTTAAAKLAFKLKKEGKVPLLVPCDLQRPAAIKQLKVLAEQAGVDFFEISDEASVLDVAKSAQKYASEKNIDTVIYDTAGRLQIDTDLMAELLILEKFVKPAEKLLVIDSLIGQESVNVAETFDTQIGITGVVLTKLDGDAKGGAALSVVEATGKAIKLASVGEKLEDLENFYPERMASRILGMGDVLTLVEKAKEKIDEAEAKRLEAELMKGNFNYETFIAAQKMMSNLGNMSSLFKMMGMGSFFSQLGLGSAAQEGLIEQGEARTAKFKAAINSMTIEERRNPTLMNLSRKRRIARGCGLGETDVNQLVNEFDKMRKMFSNLGPMLQMMSGAGASPGQDSGQIASGDSEMQNPFGSQGASLNPMDMLGSMMQGALSKKQQKALKKMGGAPGMGLGAGLPSISTKPKPKKGEKPQIKGFKS